MTERQPQRVLVVDDEDSLCDVIAIALKREGYHVTTCTDPVKAIDIYKKDPFDVVLQDLKMPRMDGIELLRTLKQIDPSALVIIMTAYSTWDRAVEAMRLGAYGYIKKPFDTQLDVKASVARALQFKELHEDAHRTLESVGLMIGNSESMKQVYNLIQRSAPTDSTVIIQGESGVGKELVARAIHYGSPRVNKPFITVNCGAFAETLLESELFGHVRGAFTGAVSEKQGLLEVANGGTFFMDEISEMSLSLQVKLLRILEEKEYKPVGGVQVKKADIRFIAATNRHLEQEVQSGRFRKDLYYRLNVIALRVPALRERKEDIPLLSGYFLSRFTRHTDKKIERFSEEARRAMMRFDWPGNIRELENAIQRAVALCEGEEVGVKDLFDASRADVMAAPTGESQQVGSDLEQLLAEIRSRMKSGLAAGAGEVDLDLEIGRIEKEYLSQAMEVSGGNYTRAAQMLKMTLRSFRYKAKKYGLDRS